MNALTLPDPTGRPPEKVCLPPLRDPGRTAQRCAAGRNATPAPGGTVYRQNFDPTGRLWLSALLAFLPLLTLLILLGGLKWKAHWAGAASLVVGLLVGTLAFKMPAGLALDAGLFGAARGALLVLWITFNAIWIYNMTVDTGHFAVLRRAFARVSDDQRVQAIVIAFCFGALIEALAGGGSPIAIASVMLIAIGFSPLRAVAISLVANTAPVAFGGLGNPITVLSPNDISRAEHFGAMTGRQTSLIAFIVPFILLYIAGGRRGGRPGVRAQAGPARGRLGGRRHQGVRPVRDHRGRLLDRPAHHQGRQRQGAAEPAGTEDPALDHRGLAGHQVRVDQLDHGPVPVARPALPATREGHHGEPRHHLHAQLAGRHRYPAVHLRPADHAGAGRGRGPGGPDLRPYAAPVQLGDRDHPAGLRTGRRHAVLRPDQQPGQLPGQVGRVLRLPVADRRLVRRGHHGYRRRVQPALRRAADPGGDRPAHLAVPVRRG